MLSYTFWRHRLIAAAAISSTFLLGGCEREDWKPDVLADAGFSHERSVLTVGRDAYQTYCVGCHGEAGDGNGPAARFLEPKPRDFRLGIIKFAAVEAGQLPLDSDFERAIREGLHGSSMPAWPFMPEDKVQALTQYLKTFAADAWADEEPRAEVVAGLDPWEGDIEGAIEEGKAVYHALARCNNCHPAYLTEGELYGVTKTTLGFGMTKSREDQYESVATETDWGDSIKPPDFLRDTLRTGTSYESLYRVIVSGVGGTAMPTWRGALPEDKLWALVHYVKSLSDLRGTQAAKDLRLKLLEQEPFQPPAADQEGASS